VAIHVNKNERVYVISRGLVNIVAPGENPPLTPLAYLIKSGLVSNSAFRARIVNIEFKHIMLVARR